MNFSLWTGWLIFEEFDLILLGALAGGYVRLACAHRPGPQKRMPGVLLAWLLMLGGFSLWSLGRGFSDAGGFYFDLFSGYTGALNSVRVFKSLGFALLFVPLLRQEVAHSGALASERLASGMVAGLTVVTLTVLWERAAYPGLLNFSSHYRTVALFWEMHVGGAAIDDYLALSTPFVAWALFSARRPMAWTAAALLALMTGYACLTTFSRGVYLAVGGSLVLLGLFLWLQNAGAEARGFGVSEWRRDRTERWRTQASRVLMLALAAEIALVLGNGSFMQERLARSDRDLGSRLEHWRQGLDLLDGAADWFVGKGLGRLPANYAAHVAQSEFSGEVAISDSREPQGGVNHFVTVRGPATMKPLGGLYALTQQVGAISHGPHRVSLQIRNANQADVYLALCERHLLYDGHCQTAVIRVLPIESEGKPAWQTLVLQLNGPGLSGGPWYARRFSVFSLSVVNAGGTADFDNVSLIGAARLELLENGHFSRGLAHWFPAAQAYFLPWHIDNLFLEVLVERGLAGFLLFSALMAYALWHLLFGRARFQALSPYLAASLCAVLLVGLVSSVMDVPRVAFLFYLLILFPLQKVEKSGH